VNFVNILFHIAVSNRISGCLSVAKWDAHTRTAGGIPCEGIRGAERPWGEGIVPFAAKVTIGWNGCRERDGSGYVFGGSACPGETEIPLDVSRLAEWRRALSQKHLSGQPDGAAGGANVSECWSLPVVVVCDAWKRRPLPRRLAQIKKLMRKPWDCITCPHETFIFYIFLQPFLSRSHSCHIEADRIGETSIRHR